MSFIRPEVSALLWRWRELILGGAVMLLGTYLLAGPGFLLALPGGAMVIVGALLALIGVQRARFRIGEGGTGAVEVNEGEIAYYGPLTGGTVSLREMEALTLDRSTHPAHWRLAQPGQPALLIPLNAAGADALFDAFATLPGLSTERMLQEMRPGQTHAVVIWKRGPLRPAGALLH